VDAQEVEEGVKLSTKQRKKRILDQFADGDKVKLSHMEHAAERVGELKSIREGFAGVFSSQLGPGQMLGPAQEALGLMMSGILNGPRSAWVNFNNIFFPFLFYGRSRVGAGMAWDTFSEGTKTVFT